MRHQERSLNGRLLPIWTEAMDIELARLAPTWRNDKSCTQIHAKLDEP